MPHIIVVADEKQDESEGAVMLRERINVSDLESQHFAAHLLERLGWALEDAQQAELAAGLSYRSASVVTTAS